MSDKEYRQNAGTKKVFQTFTTVVAAGMMLSLTTVTGCQNAVGGYETAVFVEGAVTESELRKKKAREAAKKREEVRLARKKVRREQTEKAGWLALSELEKYRSAHCYSADASALSATLASPARPKVVQQRKTFSSRLRDATGMYGSSGGDGGGERPC